MRIFIIFGVVHETNNIGSDQHIFGEFIRTNFDIPSGSSEEYACGRWPHSQAFIHKFVHKF